MSNVLRGVLNGERRPKFGDESVITALLSRLEEAPSIRPESSVSGNGVGGCCHLSLEPPRKPHLGDPKGVISAASGLRDCSVNETVGDSAVMKDALNRVTRSDRPSRGVLVLLLAAMLEATGDAAMWRESEDALFKISWPVPLLLAIAGTVPSSPISQIELSFRIGTAGLCLGMHGWELGKVLRSHKSMRFKGWDFNFPEVNKDLLVTSKFNIKMK